MQIGEFLVGPVNVDWPQAKLTEVPSVILADANVRDDCFGSLFFVDSLVIACTVGLPIVAQNPTIPPLEKAVEVFALAQPAFWWTADKIWYSMTNESLFGHH